MEEAGEQPRGDAYVYALTDEEAYLLTDDQKPAIIAQPPPDPARFKCWCCRKSYEQGADPLRRRVPGQGPQQLANETPIFICNECVARFAEQLPQ